ncbi:MAG: efflux RND transporter periplasmic adaptor subunit [Betaproteobacteria bacterium]|jgi:RND family efflux transporter MFP subunit
MTSIDPLYKKELSEADLAAVHFRAAPKRRVSRRWWVLVAVLIVAVATYIFGIQPRLMARADLKKETANLNVTSVSVTKPKTATSGQELLLPGNLQASSDTAIYARTTGYLKRWHADIGKRVKAGELLAEIDVPELDDQLQQAKADHAIADANYGFAQSTATRWEALLKTDSVSRQEVDEKRSDMAARKASLDAARYNVLRLEKLQSFKRIYAPFDGVITARNVEVGMLVDAGSAPSKEMFHLAATRRLRAFVNVPQVYARDVGPGMSAELTLVEFPGRHFKGTFARSAQSIDAVTRTLLSEVDVDNATGELLPGAYVQVHLKLSAPSAALVLPVNTLLFRPEGVMVAVLQDNHAVLTPVKLGRDYGSEVEVVSGLNATDSVILNPSDSLVSGAQVRVVQEPGKAQTGNPEPPKGPAASPAAAEKKG